MLPSTIDSLYKHPYNCLYREEEREKYALTISPDTDPQGLEMKGFSFD